MPRKPAPAAVPAATLTPKQAAFVREYLVDLNATRAARDAGYSAKTAEQQGWENLRKPQIAAAIQAAAAARAERTAITADTVLQELLRLARVDVAEAFRPDGTLKAIHEIPEATRRAIAAVEVEETFTGTGQARTWTGQVRKIKFWPKDRALELLGKHLRLFYDGPAAAGVRVDPDGTVTVLFGFDPSGFPPAPQTEPAP